MAGRFPQPFLDELLARIDIVELVDSRVPLKRSGSNYLACCPFHSEKTPSFSVSPSKQFFHCFGCGIHGDAISFIRLFDHLEFPEAVLSLAESVGLQPPDDNRSQESLEAQRTTQKLCDLQAKVANYYAQQLRAHPDSPRAIEYLKQRGISGTIARDYRLGYAPPGWNNLPAEFDQTDLLASGLLIKKTTSCYDRFRDRIMFPIRDRRGRVVGFGGRVLDDAQPKYLNSPETPIFRKHEQVYGLFEALQRSGKIERLLVVEGYMDVIALAQHGFPHTVATLGTATSTDHIELLFRFSDELVFCFDGDEAGRKAAWKALQTLLPALPEGGIVRFLALPQGDDPDSLVRREGAEMFRRRIADAQLLSDYFFTELSKDLSLESIEGRSLLIKRAQPLLQTLKPGPFRQMLRAKLGELTNNARPSSVMSPRRAQTARSARPDAQYRLLSLLAHNPQFARRIEGASRDFLLNDPRDGSFLTRLFEFVEQHPNADGTALKHFLHGKPEERYLAELSAVECLAPTDGLDREFLDTLRLIERKALGQQLDEKEAALIRCSTTRTLSDAERHELRRLQDQRRRLIEKFPDGD